MSRDEVIRIKVTPEIKEQFRLLCEKMGMSESGLGAYIIASYLLSKQ